MQQAMDIEQPENPPDFPVRASCSRRPQRARAVTIGQFYEALDAFLATLPASAWNAGRHQIVDDQFFGGQLFAVNSYADAHRAIHEIVSEGEGAENNPLDFQGEVAHYYRFGEIFHDKVLTKADNPLGYSWGPATFGVDWSGAYPAIPDPGQHDFSKEPGAAQAAQTRMQCRLHRHGDRLTAGGRRPGHRDARPGGVGNVPPADGRPPRLDRAARGSEPGRRARLPVSALNEGSLV